MLSKTKSLFSLGKEICLLFVFLSLTYEAHLFAQINFEKSYPVAINNEFGYISQLILLPDSGYIFSTTAYDNGNNFILIGRLNKLGDPIWIKQIDDSSQLKQANFALSSTGFLYVSYSALNGSPANYYSVVLKMDTTGNLLWSKSYGSTSRHESCEHIFLTSSAIYLAGEIYGPYDLYLMKLDTTGNFLWGKTYDAGGTDFLRDAKQLSNKDILLSGITTDSLYHCFSSLFRVDTNGIIVWHNRFHLPSHKEFNAQAVNEDYDGTLLISGHVDTVDVLTTTYFGLWDICLMKLSSSGNFQWGKIYGGSDYDEAWQILPTDDHGYILAAEPESFGNVSRISLMKTDSMGNIDWMKLYGKNTGGFPDNIVINEDHGYTLLATDGSYYVNAPMVFIRTDSLGNSICIDSLVTLPQKSFIPVADTIGSFGTLTGIAAFTPVISDYPLVPTDYCQFAPPVAAFFTSDSIVCEGECINFSNFSANTISWQWSFQGGNPSTSTDQNPQICYLNTGIYNVTLVASNVGGSDTLSINNYIIVNPAPPTPTIQDHPGIAKDTLVCNSDPAYISYQWYKDSTLISGATDTILVAYQNGNYNVAVTNANGCKISVGINVILGLQNYMSDHVISLWPNPVGDNLQFAISNWQNGNGVLQINIYNVLGQKTSPPTPLQRRGENAGIDVSNLAAGVYFVQLIGEMQRWVGKFVKE